MMRRASAGSICFLAFLLSSGVKGQNALNSHDLQGSLNEGSKVKSDDQNRAAESLSVLAPHNQYQTSQSDDNVEEKGSSPIPSLKGGNRETFGKNHLPFRAVPSNSWHQGNAQGLASANAQSSDYGHSNSVSSNAHADAKSLENAGRAPSYGHQEWRSGDEQAETEEAANNLAMDSLDYLSNSALRGELDLDEESELQGSSRSFGGGLGSYINPSPFSGSVSRVVPQNEYVVPHLIPGGQNVVTCKQENEIHTLWSPAYQCLICVCIREGWSLKAVCVSCNTCLKPPPSLPAPPGSSMVVIPPPPSTPPPQLLPPSISCAPLPTNTPFQNPMNPCQTCVCRKIVNVFGQDDVQIQCQENPQCVTPPELIPILPVPEPWNPVPMPLCEQLPLNVHFPHPAEHCVICMCVLEKTSITVQEKKMICQPDPNCRQLIPTTPPPFPLSENPITQYPPYSEPTPVPPELFPQPPGEIVPIPWPPKSELPTIPSPLPGPPPHETCKPYPPNQPFQHPWDECQLCMCTEIIGRGVVNIEVNCYTKKSCCIEPPFGGITSIPPKPQLPVNLLPPSYGNVIYIDPQCRYHAPKQPFVDNCNVCICDIIYGYVYAKCTPQPNCGHSSGSSSNAQANAEVIAQMGPVYSNNAPPQFPVYKLNHPLLPSTPSQSLASASSQALAQVQTGPSFLPAGGISDVITGGFYPDNQASSTLTDVLTNSGNEYQFSGPLTSSADALAGAQGGSLSLYGHSPYSQIQSQADAIAQAQSSGISQYGTHPYSLAENGQSSALSQANALSQLPNISPYGFNIYGPGGETSSNNVPSYGFNLYGQKGGTLSAAQAQAEASAQAQSGSLNPYFTFPYSLGGSQSNVPTDMITNIQNIDPMPYTSNVYRSYPQFLGDGSQAGATASAEGMAASQLYPSLYPNPTASIGSLYQPGINGWDSAAQSQAQAAASAQGLGLSGYSANSQSKAFAQAQGSATAQSLAQASALSRRPLIKSGKGLCKYAGDKYHQNCQACYCFAEADGKIYTLCLGNPCAEDPEQGRDEDEDIANSSEE